MPVTRRDFLTQTAVAATGGLTVLNSSPAQADAASAPFPTRVLGRTREHVSLIGIGCAPLGSDSTTFQEAEAVIHAALDMGITYVDVSPDYGNAEDKLKSVLKTRRDGLFLVTKVNPNKQDKQGVQEQVEASLKRMGTDHVDAVHIHNLGDFDMEKLFTEEGALAGLKAARKRGLLRFIGTSGHMRPPRFVRAIESGDIDLTMNALNFADRHTYDFEGLVLPAAHKHGTAVVAMKVLGGAVGWKYDGKTPATLAAYHERALRYSLGLKGVACAVLGLSSVDEIWQAVEVARHYKPLSHRTTCSAGQGQRTGTGAWPVLRPCDRLIPEGILLCDEQTNVSALSNPNYNRYASNSVEAGCGASSSIGTMGTNSRSA